MGAAPSRETAEQVLSDLPFYGQRQQIILIPLLKKFFPSPNCALFLQLYKARCDPAVRYHYYANDGMCQSHSTHASPVSPTAHMALESVGDVATSSFYLTDVIGNAPVYCPSADVFPPLPFTQETMYDAYITNGGEKLVYETDEEMLCAYRRDPSSVLPLPCAVAFLYHRPASAVNATSSASGGTVASERHAGQDCTAATATGGSNALPEDCTRVLGFYVKATGFIGDVRRFGASEPRGGRHLDYELQMFLTRSAGDHHRTHVLFAAVYTYAEQWQRACLHCVPCDLKAKDLTPASGPGDHSTSKDLGDAHFYYQPFSKPHDMLVEASRTVGHLHLARTERTDAGEPGQDALESGDTGHFWAPPPLLALVMRSRRANVPLLCFLREVRACARSLFLFYLKHCLEHCTTLKEGSSEDAVIASNGGHHSTEGQPPILSPHLWANGNCGLEMPPPGSTLVWLQEARRLSVSPAEDNDGSATTDTETMLNFYMTAGHVRTLTEFVISCLLHHINPLDVLRLSSSTNILTTKALTSSGDGKKESDTTEEATAADAPGSDASRISSSTAAALLAANPVLAHAVSLVRLPDEDMLVQPWPPTSPGAILSTAPSASADCSDSHLLSAWRLRYTNYHLFWVVGPDVVKRRSATAAFLHWYGAEKAPVVWGYSPDAAGHDAAAVRSEGTTADGGGVSPQLLSSCLESCMCTVEVDGQEEKLLCCNTVLSLVALASGVPAESRVLRVCRLPLEELLLGELRNASKLAREAGPDDPHWVRQVERSGKEGYQEKFAGCVLHASDPAEEGATAMTASHGAEVPVVPPEADGVVGDGTSCLWRIDVVDVVYRIIAVTPQFLKPIRKKHLKKKRLQCKEVARHSPGVEFVQPVLPTALATVSATAVAFATTQSAHHDDTESKHRATVRDSIDAGLGIRGPVTPEIVPSSGVAAVLGCMEMNAVSALCAPGTRATKSQKMTNINVDPPSSCTSTAAPSNAVEEAARAASASVGNAVAGGAGQVNCARSVRVKPVQGMHFPKRAEAAPAESPATAAHEAAVSSVTQHESSPSSYPAGPAASGPQAVMPTAAPAAFSFTADIPMKTGDALLGANATRVYAITPATAYAQSPTAARPRMASAIPQPLQPRVAPGVYNWKGECDASAAAGASCGPPGYSCHPPPPAYDACPLFPLPPPPVLRGPCEPYGHNHGYDYRVLPPALACADTQSVSQGIPHCNGYDDVLDTFQSRFGTGGGCNIREKDTSVQYIPSRGGGGAGAVGAGRLVGDSGCSGDPYYAYTHDLQHEKAQPTLRPSLPNADVGDGDSRGDGVVRAGPYSLLSKCGGVGYEASLPPVAVAAGAHVSQACSETDPCRGTRSNDHVGALSLQRCVGFGADILAPRGGSVRETLHGSPTEEGGGSLQRGSTPGLCAASAMPSISSNVNYPIHCQTTIVAPPRLPRQGSGTYSPRVLHDSEGGHHASVSSTGALLQFQPDEINSIATSDSNTLIANVQHSSHTRYVSSPYRVGTARVEDVGLACSEGGSPRGGPVNVTVRIRQHHNHLHSRTASYFSDTTTDPVSAHFHPLHDSGHYMNSNASVASGGGSGGGAASPTGVPISYSFGSAASSSILLHGACCVAAGAACEHGSPRGCDPHHPPAFFEDFQQQHRHHPLGAVVSSTRSSDTVNTARLVHQRTGTYRWDWRTASLDIGDED